MNWAAVNFDWNQVRAFLATVEEGTLSGAARALNLTQPTLGRQVTALEESLKITLFERVGKSLVLTQAGLDLLEHVRQMGAAAERISLSAAGHNQDVTGEVRISVSDGFAAYTMPALLVGLREIAPGLIIEVLSQNQISDIRRREADIAVRHLRPEDPELFAKRLPDGSGGLYASRDWLDRHGRPEKIEDLNGKDMVAMANPEIMLAEMRKRGINLTSPNIRLSCAETVANWQMVRAGLGFGVMSDAVGDQFPDLERIDIPGLEPVLFPNWLITHRELHTSRRIRIVFDYMAEALSGLPKRRMV